MKLELTTLTAFRFFIIISFWIAPYNLFAQVVPSILSFDAYPTSIASGQPVSFSWILQSAGGYSFNIPCTSGIKIVRQGGSTFSCSIPLSSTLATNDSLTLLITNISGGTKNISASLTPKDASGQNITSAKQDILVSIGTDSQPITSFASSATTTTPGKPITISWGAKSDGVNLLIACSDSIRASSPQYAKSAFLPCDTTIFSPDLPASSSLSLTFSNSSPNAIPQTLTLLPAMSAGVYDGTHPSRLSLTIASDLTPDPIITSFNTASYAVNSGEGFALSWTSQNSKGLNLKISCVAGITASSSMGPSNPLPCDTLALTNGLAANGSLNLQFNNTSQSNQNITLTLIPSRSTGTYDATLGKSITITAKTPNSSNQIYSTPTPSIAPNLTQPAITTQTANIPIKIIFTQTLKRGLQNQQVTLLQQFLGRDALLYPENLITGFFGPATERAVQRFQKKYGLVSGGSPATAGYGMVGPKTRAKLNSLQ